MRPSSRSSQRNMEIGLAPTAQTATMLLQLQLWRSSEQEAKGRAIRDNLRDVANPPVVVVTDIIKGLRLIRQGQKINCQDAFGRLPSTRTAMSLENAVCGSSLKMRR